MLGEDMAEAEKVARLRGVGLIANDGGQRSDGAGIIAAAVFDEADVEADAGHFRGQLFGFLKKCESVVPLLAAHGDYAEIGIGGARLRIKGENPAKGGFSGC